MRGGPSGSNVEDVYGLKTIRTLVSLVRVSLEAWKYVCFFLCCILLCT